MTSITADSMQTRQLYWEARGSGRPVLLIAGTPGDGGQFDGVVERLAYDHLTITYDRRGTSRSVRGFGCCSTSVSEQADDAARVLSAVGVQEAIVFGTSNGGAVALEFALRHPRRLTGVMLHELPLLSVLRDPDPVASAMGSVIGAAMKAGGPSAALEAFLRFAFGDEALNGWTPAFRARILSNARMVFDVELPAFQAYHPDPGALIRCAVPAQVLIGEQQELPFFREAGEWLASHLSADISPAPGAHGPQFTHPGSLAATIRAFSRSV